MPRYYYDVDDGGRVVRDRHGIELPDVDHAKGKALAVLRALSEGAEPEGETILACVVRCEDGSPAHRITMTIEGCGEGKLPWGMRFDARPTDAGRRPAGITAHGAPWL